MTVTAFPNDVDGAALSEKVTSLKTQAAALDNGPSKFAAEMLLDQTQRELVDHYLARGRITAATVLLKLA